MTGLQYLDDNLKGLIDRIITNYQLDIHYMEDDTEGVTYGPGIIYNNAFSDDFTLIHFETKNGKLTINIESSKLEYNSWKVTERNNYKTNNAALLHANFMESIHFMKWLAANDLIYFTKENKRFNVIPEFDASNYVPHYSQANWIIGSDTICEFISSHYNSRIIPSPYLISFYNNGYRTDEQLQYDTQIKISKRALKRAKHGIIISIIIGCASLFSSYLFAKCVDSTIKEEQHNELIEAIKNHG